ncbi:uncharacterized protein FA14DRAFT_138069 [Meira miltonrushii]|uniref:C2 domain-containing protein n=1 Tax=Meira miltonrushii TaxID=1280837 RepID=A0A316V654_9BASI|nr:uncharacterized protein FA14DRAFT_138069 [Meira miltonrushii]PWN32922.1 hypothetical protein FA14DRAFT_138069 [Meira miltonrushii]
MPKITQFFVVSAFISIVLTRFVHWFLALLLVFILAYVLRTQLSIAADDSEWTKAESARIAQQETDEKRSESVEWMNAVLKTVWPLINQDYFVPFIDLMEDALMQQVPGIVHGCRVEDLDQGTVPLHIQSFSLLDSSEVAFIDGATASEIHDMDVGMENHEDVMKHAEDSGKGDIGFDVGEFVNLELTFAYRSPAARRKKMKSNRADGVMTEEEREAQVSGYQSELPIDQIHMLIYMAIGLQKIAAVEIPVWCEVLGIEGKMRLRLQLVPTAPFVAHVAFTFVGKPKIEISAKPLGRRMVIDAMHLPIISSYVLHSIEAVVKNFISPHSYTVDIASLLEAQDGPRNVYALGVVVLIIHQGINLPAADANGMSDPFVSVSFARAGKPLFTTRVLLKTKDPIWHEMAILPVSPDEVRDQERLRMTVFDADRFSVDDPLGKVEVSIDKLINRALQHHNEEGKPSLMETQTEDIRPMRKGAKVQGRLSYSVGFFRLSKPSQGKRTAGKANLLRQAADRHEDTPVSGASLSEQQEKQLPVLPDTPSTPPKSSDPSQDKHRDDLYRNYTTPFDRFVHSIGFPLDEKVLAHRKERKDRVKKLTTMMEGEAHATFGPPSKVWKTGILAFHIHSIEGLGFEGPQKSWSNSKRLSQKPQYAADEDVLGEGTSKMPNSYVQVLINDEAVYRTRTKTFNPQPFFNAGTERIVSEFDTARIDLVVRDARQRENDPILGVVGIKLSDVITSSCRVTQWYTLTGGLGYGKIRLTLLWRSVELNIPAQLRGWNVGVIEVASCFVGGVTASHKAVTEKRDVHIAFETVGGRAETEPVTPEVDEGKAEHGRDALSYKWVLTTPVRIAVTQRYPNFLYMHLRSDSRVPGRSHRIAHAVIPMNRLDDNTEVRKKVPIYETSDWQQFEQDVLRDMTKEDQLAESSKSVKKLMPIMEEMVEDTNGEAAGKETKDAKGDSALKQVGYLDIVLVFHPGLGPEHRSILAGDNELRAAFECFQTLVDCGQRPQPRMLSVARKRKLSTVGPRQAAGVVGSESGMIDISAANKEANDLQDDDFDSDELEGEIPSDNDGTVEDDDGLIEGDTPEGRRARARNLHRQQRGAAQVKSFRTLQWLKTNAEDGVVRMKRIAKKEQSKRIAKMESEGVSHF